MRLFNTVGPRQTGHYGMVIPRFVGQAIKGEPITVYGDGGQTRCFCYVGDVVAGCSRWSTTRRRSAASSTSAARRRSRWSDLADRVIERSGQRVKVDLVPYEEAYEEGFEDMQRRVPDTAKIQGLTGWQPRRTLDDVLDDAIAYSRRELGLEDGMLDLMAEEQEDLISVARRAS